ncbi:MAG: ribokinase [Spirochaetota bacterium]
MKAIVVGSANTDMIIHVHSLPLLGDTQVGYGYTSGPGGKGANQAVCLSRLGAYPHLIARFGKDDTSSILMEEINRQGINMSHAVIDEKHNGGVVFIIVDKTGNNTMIADFGSNQYLDQYDIQNAASLFEGAGLLLLQLEVSDSANKKACELAVKNGLRVSLNPAPMRPFDTSILKFVDVLTPNLFELSRMLEYLEGKVVVPVDEKDHQKIITAARKLIELGVNHVVVTMGERGSVYINQKASCNFGTYRVNQRDSTAAGDAFTAAFALRFTEGADVSECVRFASASAAIAVTGEGAIPSLPNREKVEGFMMSNKFEKFV